MRSRQGGPPGIGGIGAETSLKRSALAKIPVGSFQVAGTAGAKALRQERAGVVQASVTGTQWVRGEQWKRGQRGRQAGAGFCRTV